MQMKPCRKNPLFTAVVTVVVSFLIAARLAAQSFTTVYHFTRGGDGASPYDGLISSGGILYGTAYYGGSSSKGTVFKVSTNGTGFATLHSFPGGSDGANPSAGLLLLSNTLYGTTVYGGNSGAGTVFKVDVNGGVFASLYSFAGGSGGANPLGGLVLLSNTLYGTAYHSSPGGGTVFAIGMDGTGFTNLYTFSGASDGANPKAGLILSGDVLYGTSQSAGLWSGGTVFAVNTDGTGFTTLYNFSGGDGANPGAGLVLSEGTLYGTSTYGGIQGAGTVFAISADGAEFTDLYSFTGGIDGANPSGGLILLGNKLYGTSAYGGVSGNGTVFAINTDGTSFKVVHNFTATIGTFATNDDGAHPVAGLVLVGDSLYGTASDGGKYGNGTLFSVTVPVPPQLRIQYSGENVILTWPTNSAGFALLSATNLVSPVDWAPVLPTPAVVNGQNAVTNAVSGTQQFYRLSQ
jgi:uncharacterized repeat protein (TIGR03803 family)